MRRISVARCWHASVKLATQSFTLATIPSTRTLRCAVAPRGQRSCRRFSPRTVKQCWRRRLIRLSLVCCSLLPRTPCTARTSTPRSSGQPAAIPLLLAILLLLAMLLLSFLSASLREPALFVRPAGSIDAAAASDAVPGARALARATNTIRLLAPHVCIFALHAFLHKQAQGWKNGCEKRV